MNSDLNRLACTFAVALSAGLMAAGPAGATTTQAFAQLSDMQFSFSDASSAIELPTVVTQSGGMLLGNPMVYKFNQRLAGFAVTNNSWHDAAFTLGSSSTANSLTSSAQVVSWSSSAVQPQAATEFWGNVYIAPHSTVTFSANYSLSASVAEAPGGIAMAHLRLMTPGQGAGVDKSVFPSNGKVEQDLGSLSQVWSNNGSTGINQYFDVRATAMVYLPGTTLPVPEPDTWALSVFGLALTGVGAWRKRARATTT